MKRTHSATQSERTCETIQGERTAKRREIGETKKTLERLEREESELEQELRRNTNYVAFSRAERLRKLRQYLGDPLYAEWVEKHKLLMISFHHSYETVTVERGSLSDDDEVEKFGLHKFTNVLTIKVAFEGDPKSYELKCHKHSNWKATHGLAVLKTNPSLWKNASDVWAAASDQYWVADAPHQSIANAMFSFILALDGLNINDAEVSIFEAILEKRRDILKKEQEDSGVCNGCEEERAEQLNPNLTCNQPDEI